MAKLIVYIQKIESNSWLHWSPKGNSSCLRDFRDESPKEIRKYNTQQIEEMVKEPGNIGLNAPGQNLKKKAHFWKKLITTLNEKIGPDQINQLIQKNDWGNALDIINAKSCEIIKKVEQTTQGTDVGVGSNGSTDNLVNRFKAEVCPLILHNRIKELNTLLTSWKQRFSSVERKYRFNHWDDKDASDQFGLDTGIGWTSIMLERCREGGELKYIKVRNGLDFALISMELNLCISSEKNLFRLGHGDSVKPDGLGVRKKDGTYCVVEVKGPQDKGSLYEATLQALCGALAVAAKREMILAITKEPGKRRPKIMSASLPAHQPSIGLYVIMSEFSLTGTNKVSDDPDLRMKMEMILQACPIVCEIVHFVINPKKKSLFDSLTPFEIFVKP